MRGGAEPRVAAAALMAQRARPRYAGGREERMGRRRLCFRACSNGLRHSFKKTKQNKTLLLWKKKKCRSLASAFLLLLLQAWHHHSTVTRCFPQPQGSRPWQVLLR